MTTNTLSEYTIGIFLFFFSIIIIRKTSIVVQLPKEREKTIAKNKNIDQ
jgi:hypothetical protein